MQVLRSEIQIAKRKALLPYLVILKIKNNTNENFLFQKNNNNTGNNNNNKRIAITPYPLQKKCTALFERLKKFPPPPSPKI